MSINKISGVSFASIAKLSGISKSSIVNFLGIAAGGSSSSMSLSDVTTTVQTVDFSGTQVPPATITLNLPSTAASGDLVFLLVSSDGSSGHSAHETPSGWTRLTNWASFDSDNDGYVFYRVFDGTEGSSVTISNISGLKGGGDHLGISFIADGADTSSPVSDYTSAVIANGVNTISITGTTASANGLAVGFYSFDGADGNPFSVSSGWTEVVDEDSPSTGNSATALAVGVSTKPVTAGSASGTLVVDGSGTLDGFAGLQFIIKEA